MTNMRTQRKNNAAVSASKRRASRNSPNHRPQRQSLQKGKRQHEMLGHWRPVPVPNRVVPLLQGLRRRPLRSRRRGSAEAGHGKEGAAQTAGRRKHRCHAAVDFGQ
mmetsp:Transcript_2056/g.2967  ORF Transcript_2056/g.2967 Transcript_2056/m.2967 type:complete len:106 (+) Transcript_2056:125-442(+)